MLECDLDRLDDRADRLGKALRDLPLADHDLLGNAVHQVAALDFHHPALAVLGHAGRADLLLDPFGAALADQEIMVAPDISYDRLIHLVAADPHRPRIDDAAQGEDRHLGGAAADIDNHRPGRLGHRQSGADCRCHRLLDQKDPARAGAFRRFLDGTSLDRGRPRGYAYDDLRAGKAAPVVNLADEMLDHFLRDLEIGDDTVAQRPDRLDAAWRAAQHQLGLLTDGEYQPLPLDAGNRHHRRLVEDDPTALDVD